jgi:Fur family ferric uptake transcriptional regulator
MRKRGPWWHNKFSSEGLRLTLPRQAIMDILNKSNKHLSAEDIYFTVHKKYPGIGLTTIYRTLDLLLTMGVLYKFDFGDGKARYELISKMGEHHHHLICKRCGKIIDYDEFLEEEKGLVKKIENTLSKKHRFKIDSHQLHFYGLCSNCQNR